MSYSKLIEYSTEGRDFARLSIGYLIPKKNFITEDKIMKFYAFDSARGTYLGRYEGESYYDVRRAAWRANQGFDETGHCIQEYEIELYTTKKEGMEAMGNY